MNQTKLNIYWIILCFFICKFNTQSQSRSIGTMGMVSNPRPSRTSQKIDSSQYLKALNIYNRLVNARGDYRYPAPRFIMTGSDTYVAFMDYKTQEISIESKAYKVCSKFGVQESAALAFLLGHELTHYYEKHAWKKGFASEFKDLAIGLKIDSLQEDISNETQADYLGGFLAYSAGFGIFDKGPELIKELYKEYNLPEKLKKYPSLSDRQKMGQRMADRLKELIQVFDLANLLIITGNYSEALPYFKFILNKYQSRELYNNLGVCFLLNSMEYFTESELKFRYPIQLDLESPARAGFANLRDTLIKQAILFFESAIHLDPNYGAAYLNKACALALLGDSDRAEFYASVEAKAIADSNLDSMLMTKIDVLLGILEEKKGNIESAKKLFENAFKQGNALAEINLKILNKDAQAPKVEKRQTGLVKKEKLDNQDLSELIDNDRFVNKKKVFIEDQLICNYIENQGPNSFLLIAQNERTATYYYFHGVKKNTKEVTVGKIKQGSSRAEVLNYYGKPNRILETPIGPIFAYNSIIFMFDSEDKVDRWYIYAIDR